MPSAGGQTALWIAVGLAIGAALGVSYHDLGIGLVVGVLFGLALSRIARTRHP